MTQIITSIEAFEEQSKAGIIRASDLIFKPGFREDRGLFDWRYSDSNVYFEVPHAGLRVPEELWIDGNPLGIPLQVFPYLHEAVDLKVRELMDEMIAQRPDVNFLMSRISRLVADLNRTPHRSIEKGDTTEIRDFAHLLIPANQGLTQLQEEVRLAAYYSPYFHKNQKIIDRLNDKKDPRTRILKYSIHTATPSFTTLSEENGQPVMHTEKRDFEIGVLFRSLTEPVMKLIESLEKLGVKVSKNDPYDLTSHDFGDRTAMIELGRVLGEDYPLIEVNSDLLKTREDTQRIASILNEAIDMVNRDLNPHLFMGHTLEEKFRQRPGWSERPDSGVLIPKGAMA